MYFSKTHLNSVLIGGCDDNLRTGGDSSELRKFVSVYRISRPHIVISLEVAEGDDSKTPSKVLTVTNKHLKHGYV